MPHETSPSEQDNSPAVDQCTENLSFIYFFNGTEQVFIRPENVIAVVVLTSEATPGWDVKIWTTLGHWKVRCFASEESASAFAMSVLHVLPDHVSRRLEAEEKGIV